MKTKAWVYALLMMMVCGVTSSFGQRVPVQKPLAPFDIELSNGKRYTSKDVAKGPVILMYFSPDCGHCKEFTTELLKHPNAFNDKQIVMVTFTPKATVEQFERNLFLSMFPNIKVGTEGEGYKVMRYYGVRTFPYLALYNKAGQLVKTYEGEQPFSTVLNSIKSLK